MKRLFFILIFSILIIGCVSDGYKFTYNDNIMVIDGFFRDCQGYVKDVDRRFLVDSQYMVWLTFCDEKEDSYEATHVWINEQDLELMKENKR